MTIDVTLANVGSLLDATTAQTTLNNNNTAIVAGFENALNTSGDQMQGTLDMNSNSIINLAAPATPNSPVRAVDMASFEQSGGIPLGGTVGQVLTKTGTSEFVCGWTTPGDAVTPGGSSGSIQYNSGGNFGGFTVSGDGTIDTSTGELTVTKTNGTAFAPSATIDTTNGSNISSGTVSAAHLPVASTISEGIVQPDGSTIIINDGVITAVTSGTGTVSSVGLSLPADFTVSGTPVTGAGTLTAVWANTPTGTGSVVRATTPTLVGPNIGTPSAGTLTNCTGLPISTGVSGLGTGVSSFLVAPSSANLASALTTKTGTGTTVFSTSPTITTPTILQPSISGFTDGSSAAAGIVGEYKSNQLPFASAISLTNSTPTSVVSVSLTAGEWDVWGYGIFSAASSTVTQALLAGVSTANNTMPSFDNFGRAEIGYGNGVTGSTAIQLPIPVVRLVLTVTTTVYIVISAFFTTSTMTGAGGIAARRVR